MINYGRYTIPRCESTSPSRCSSAYVVSFPGYGTTLVLQRSSAQTSPRSQRSLRSETPQVLTWISSCEISVLKVVELFDDTIWSSTVSNRDSPLVQLVKSQCFASGTPRFSPVDV